MLELDPHRYACSRGNRSWSDLPFGRVGSGPAPPGDLRFGPQFADRLRPGSVRPHGAVITEQRGVIRVIKDGVVQSTPFLNITSLVQCCGEQGLLGLAFPPNYGSSGRFFVNYTRAGDGRIVVARYRRSGNPLVADTQGFPLVWSTGEDSIRHPFSNHNAGCMNFGLDGYLYLAG